MSLSKRLRRYADSDLLVSPRLEDWLSHNPNMEFSPEVIEHALRKELGTPQRDRTMTFSASARGACSRAQVFYFTPVQAIPRMNPDLHAKFHDGTFRHIRWQMWLLQSGILDDIEVSASDPTKWLTGTIDGVGTISPELAQVHGLTGANDQLFGWELKGCGSRQFRFVLDEGPRYEHLLQVHAYFLLRPDIRLWSLVYEDKDSQEWKEFVVTRNASLLDEVSREIRQLRAYVEQEVLPPVLDECAKKQGRYKTCEFAHACLSHGHEWPTAERRIKRPKGNR